MSRDYSLTLRFALPPPPIPDGIPIQRAEIDVAVSSIDLAGAELALSSMIGRERALQKALLPIRSSYDYLMLDTPPSLRLLTLNPLTAAPLSPLICVVLSAASCVLLSPSTAVAVSAANCGAVRAATCVAPSARR